MFSNFFALFKTFFVQQFRLREVTKRRNKANVNKKRKRLSPTLVTYLILIVVLTPTLIAIAIALYNLGKVQGREQGDIILSTLMLICQGIVMLFGVTSIITNVFASTDGDRLLCLPVRASTIFLAKMSVVYINEVMMSAITILFLMLPYGIGAGLGVAFYIMLVLAMLLLPMLPLMLASIVAIPIAFLLRKFSNNGVVKVVMQIVLYICFMGLYLLFMTSFMDISVSIEGGTPEQTIDALRQLIENFANNARPVLKWILPNWFLAQSMVATTFVSVLLNALYTIGINLALFAIVFGVSLLMYKSSLQGSLEQGGSRKKFAFSDKDKTQTGKKANLTYTLMITDFKRTMRNSQLGFQMIVGIIMLPVLIIILGVSMGKSFSMEGGFDYNSGLYQIICSLVLLDYLALLASSSNALGLYPITRENKTFYMLKTLPIAPERLLFAKILLATIVMSAVSFVSAILAVIFFKIKWYWAIPCMITLVLVQFGSMCITTYLDIRRPTLGWVNFKQSLSNSRNTLYTILISLLITLVIGGLGFAFVILYTLSKYNVWVIVAMWIVLIGLGALYAYIAFRKSTKAGIRRFDEIEE